MHTNESCKYFRRMPRSFSIRLNKDYTLRSRHYWFSGDFITIIIYRILKSDFRKGYYHRKVHSSICVDANMDVQNNVVSWVKGNRVLNKLYPLLSLLIFNINMYKVQIVLWLRIYPQLFQFYSVKLMTYVFYYSK